MLLQILLIKGIKNTRNFFLHLFSSSIWRNAHSRCLPRNIFLISHSLLILCSHPLCWYAWTASSSIYNANLYWQHLFWNAIQYIKFNVSWMRKCYFLLHFFLLLTPTTIIVFETNNRSDFLASRFVGKIVTNRKIYVIVDLGSKTPLHVGNLPGILYKKRVIMSFCENKNKNGFGGNIWGRPSPGPLVEIWNRSRKSWESGSRYVLLHDTSLCYNHSAENSKSFWRNYTNDSIDSIDIS